MEKYIVTLESREREQLEALVGKGRHAAQTVVSALILLTPPLKIAVKQVEAELG